MISSRAKHAWCAIAWLATDRSGALVGKSPTCTHPRPRPQKPRAARLVHHRLDRSNLDGTPLLAHLDGAPAVPSLGSHSGVCPGPAGARVAGPGTWRPAWGCEACQAAKRLAAGVAAAAGLAAGSSTGPPWGFECLAAAAEPACAAWCLWAHARWRCWWWCA